MRKTFLVSCIVLSILTVDSPPVPVSVTGGNRTGEAVPPRDTIDIASFNLGILGPSKAGNTAILDILARIVRRFDIVAVQEIRDAGGKAVVALKAAVNAAGRRYEYALGPRLGRSTSKEQYAIFYDTAVVTGLSGMYTFDEGGKDSFEREPLVAGFRAAGFDFALVVIHTTPSDAAAEIAFLPEVMADAAEKFGEPDIICLGDFNADRPYYDERNYADIFPPERYGWLIGNDLDTTVGASASTADRIVISSSCIEDFEGSSGVFAFDAELDSSGVAPRKVSDHYPVWARFWTGKDGE